MKIKRGDIYIVDLGEGFGSEQGGIRPALVVQNNIGNKYSHTLLIACITSKANTKHHLPTHYTLPDNVGLNHNSMVMMEQIRIMKILDKRIMISFGLKRYKKRGKTDD